MKRTLSTLFCLTMIACADAGDDEIETISSPAEAPLPFESNTRLELLPLDDDACYTGGQGLTAGFTVLQDANSFRSAYLAARPDASQVPVVDFANYVVVEAVVAQEGGCGAQIQLDSATNRSDHVEVVVRTSHGGCATPAGTSYTFAFARVNRLEKPYLQLDVSDDLAGCPAPTP